MQITQATLYTFDPHHAAITHTRLQEAFTRFPFTPCAPTQERSSGFTPPRGQEHGALVEVVDGHYIARFEVETKSVPADIITREREAQCAAIQKQTGRTPGATERRELQYDIRLSLLPKAFPKRKAIPLWLDLSKGLMVLGSASPALTDSIISDLVGANIVGKDRLLSSVNPLQWGQSVTLAIAHWLLDPDGLDGSNLTPCASATFKGDEGRAVTYKETLGAARVQELIHQGLRPVSLQLHHATGTTFHLHEGGLLKKITLPTPADAEADGEEDAFNADAYLTISSLSAVITDLRRALAPIQD